MESLDNTYNGWSNWETWNLLLWANNDEFTYKEMRRFANSVSTLVQEQNQRRACIVFFNDIFPTGTPDMEAGDMNNVDWGEVLEAVLEEVES